MKEITGNLWDFDGQPGYTCCITTNGTIRKDGLAVMGRGCAKEAAERYPHLPKILGDHLLGAKEHGNVVWNANVGKDGQYHFLLIFPTKHNWRDRSDLELIKHSAIQLSFQAHRNPRMVYILPRPGCNNGGLKWEEVKAVIGTILPDNVWVISND